MDIDGFGEKLVDQLVEKGHIMSVADIFNITHDQLASLDRMGNKSATKVISAIAIAKPTTFARFIHALGIRNVGEHASKVLEKSFSGSLEELIDSDIDQLTAIYEIGDIMAKSICNFFQESNNRKIIQACLDAGIQFAKMEKIQESEYMGKTFVFTGSLGQLSRKDAKSMVEKLGARASNTVSSKTDFVIAGASAGSKLENAQKLKIYILSEDEFLEMMENKLQD